MRVRRVSGAPGHGHRLRGDGFAGTGEGGAAAGSGHLAVWDIGDSELSCRMESVLIESHVVKSPGIQLTRHARKLVRLHVFAICSRDRDGARASSRGS